VIERDLRLVHRLQQAGLGLGRRAVDLVGQDDVAEERAGLEDELAAIGLVDGDADDVRRQHVRGELDPLKVPPDGAGQRRRQRGLAHARHVLDQQVPAGQQGDQGKLNRFFLAENRAGDGTLQLRNDLRGGGRHWLKTPNNPATKEGPVANCF
jgi:hypothetical protein